ncbi:MAG: radical SAM protein [Myxococcota bacterium]|nr:radical SAM protein [Myxococcota bacterium]
MLTPSPPRRLDFKDHRRSLGENRYVYPVVSRRSGGLSIGINLNPDKVCNFDCPYCQVDRSIAPAFRSVDEAILLAELEALLSWAADGTLWQRAPFDTVRPDLRRLCDLAFSGDGEPTSYAGLAGLIDRVADVRDEYGFSDVPLVAITNASLFHRKSVGTALERLHARGGRVWAKLDAGTDPYFKWVCGTSLSLDRICTNIAEVARIWPVHIQSMFLQKDGEAASEEELDAWGERLQAMVGEGAQIERVQVYTVARKPADPSLGPLSVDQLEGIADRARACGLVAEIYP